MKTLDQLYESIDRFKHYFWYKEKLDHPPVGISSDGSNTPIVYLRKDFKGTQIFPEDVNAELCMTDYEYISLNRRVVSDDWMPWSAAWRAIPWLEAMSGCPVKYAYGSLAPEHYVHSLNTLLDIELPANKEWLECYKRQTEELVETAPPDCWISPTILRGSSDVISAMRGLTDFYLDLVDDIKIVDEMASRVTDLFIEVLKIHYSIVKPYLGGYVHNYGYWAPEQTYTIQEDALGMCSPDTYRDVFMKYNVKVVETFGPCIFFHLHSTGYKHYKEILKVPGIAGIELTIEENGPPLRDMVDDLKEILKDSRLILFAYHYFEDLPDVLRLIPHEGFYLQISDKFIQSEKDFRQFITTNW